MKNAKIEKIKNWLDSNKGEGLTAIPTNTGNCTGVVGFTSMRQINRFWDKFHGLCSILKNDGSGWRLAGVTIQPVMDLERIVVEEGYPLPEDGACIFAFTHEGKAFQIGLTYANEIYN